MAMSLMTPLYLGRWTNLAVFALSFSVEQLPEDDFLP